VFTYVLQGTSTGDVAHFAPDKWFGRQNITRSKYKPGCAWEVEHMKLSARNTLKDVKTGTVNTEVVVLLAGGEELVSMITKESAEKTRIETGKGRLRGDQGFQCNDRNGLKN